MENGILACDPDPPLRIPVATYRYEGLVQAEVERNLIYEFYMNNHAYQMDAFLCALFGPKSEKGESLWPSIV